MTNHKSAIGIGPMYLRGATLLIITAIAFTGACAHSTLDKKLDSEMAQEHAIKNRADLRNEADRLLVEDRDLTPTQRSQLMDLRTATRSQVEGMSSESLKLRSVLIKDLISTSYNEGEVELIKQRLQNLESKRLSVLFGAVEQANKILGHQAVAKRDVIDEFFHEKRESKE